MRPTLIWLAVLIAACAVLVAALARAQTPLCGFPPFPPYGCEYTCVCDALTCHWVLICDAKEDDDAPDSD